MVQIVDVVSPVCIRPSLVVLFPSLTSSCKVINSTNLVVAVVELALVDLIHQQVLVSSRSMVKSTLLLRRREVMVAVEALSHMCMLDFGHVIGQCMGSIPMRKP
jgi:hypothetical protein